MGEMATPTTQSKTRNYYDDDDVREQIAEQIAAHPFGRTEVELYRAFPGDYSCTLPEAGGWIIVKGEPHTVIPNPPLYSIWWARPIYMARQFKHILVDGRRRTVTWPMLQARIATEHGDLDLYPVSEFATTSIDKWLEFIGHGVEPHFIGEQPDELGDRMFYIQSRGIPARDALLMSLPGLEEGGSFVYFTLDL